MIENHQQLEATYDALGSAYLSLAALRQDLFASNPERYIGSAQPAVRVIGRLRAEIDTYLGLNDAEPLQEPPPFVIENDEQLRGTHQAMGYLYRALASLRRDLPSSSRQYGLFAEGPIHEILKLQAEIDAYLSLNAPAPQVVVLRETPQGFGKPK